MLLELLKNHEAINSVLATPQHIKQSICGREWYIMIIFSVELLNQIIKAQHVL